MARRPLISDPRRGVHLPDSVLRLLLPQVDPLTNLFLVLPLFVVYHLGVVLLMERGPDGQFRWVGNGVDFLTGTALSLAGGNVLVYAGVSVGVTALLAGLIVQARRHAKLSPRLFVPVLIESAVYALLMAISVGSVVSSLGLGVLDANGLAAKWIASAGAGLHEELVFRMGLFHGTGYLLARRLRPWAGWLVAAVLSSFAFSAMHYLGPLGDPLRLSSFVFRLLLGVVLAGVYKARGFAIAAWTHTLYDVMYFTLRGH